MLLSEAIKINYVGDEDAAWIGLKRVLNPWLFDEDMYHRHIDLYCEVWHFIERSDRWEKNG